MKRLKIALLGLFLGLGQPLWAEESALDFVPPETFGFIAFDSKQMIDSFFTIFKGENPAVQAMNRVMLKLAENNETPVSKEVEAKGYFGDFSEKLKLLQDPKSGTVIEKGYLFFQPQVKDNPSAANNFLLILDGQFDLGKMKEYIKGQNPKAAIEELSTSAFKGLKITAEDPGGKSSTSSAFLVHKSLFVGAEEFVKPLLEKKGGANILKGERFEKAVTAWEVKKPFFYFAARPKKEDKMPFQLAVGGVTAENFEVKSAIDDKEEAKKYEAEMNQNLETARDFVAKTEPQFSASGEIGKKGSELMKDFFSSLSVTNEEGKVTIKGKNPGLEGFSFMIASFGDVVVNAIIEDAKARRAAEQAASGTPSLPAESGGQNK